MKALTKLIALTALAVFLSTPALAKGKPEAAPEGSKMEEHSNAPATESQVKGTERALEVGQGEEKGLQKDAPEAVQEKGKSEMKKAEKKGKETPTAEAPAAE